MTKIWQLRVLTTYLTLGVPLAVSCAREANTLEGDDDDTSSTAGTKTSGGGASKAGASNTAGATSKAGASSAFGGTASMGGTGGSGTAGSKAAGGNASTTAGSAAGGTAGAGTGGSSGSAGAGGTPAMIPPEVLARASAVVYYQTMEAAAMDGKIQMKLFIKNQSADPLPMANVKIRYWFTAEVATELHQYFTGEQARPAMAMFVNDAANSHALMTFGGGVIKQGQDINFSEIQLEITNNTGKFNQADDFSWQPTSVASTPNDKITLYLDDTLIWGCEPSGKCVDDGSGGAGGAP
jgi:endoglucanase